jgi:hypothetical protein
VHEKEKSLKSSQAKVFFFFFFPGEVSNLAVQKNHENI